MEVVIEVAVLFAMALPFARLMVCPPFLRRLGGAPELAVAGVALLFGYLAAIVVVAVVAPVLLRPLVVVAVVVAAAAWWRARPERGVARGLPRGSLRIAPLGPWVDPDYFADDARRFGPVFKTSTLFAPVVCVVGLPAALDLFRQHDKALIPPTPRISRFIPAGFLRSMTDEDHAHYAPLLRSAISAAVTRQAEPDIAAMVHSELARLADSGEVVPVGALSRRIVFLVFMRLFFGIGPTDPDLPRLEGLYREIDPIRAWRSSAGRTQRAVDRLVSIVGRHRAADSFLATARAAYSDEVDDPNFMRNLVYMLLVSGSDVSGALAWVMSMLSTDPESVERLREDPQPGPQARRVVMETLRMEQSEFMLRSAAEEIHWNGYVIPKGWRVRICTRESHRDPAVFTDPDRFDPDRFKEAPPPRDHYSAFGAATTRTTCLGEGLTLNVGRIFVEELVRGFDWQVVSSGKPEFSGVHWRPNSRFAVSLAARRVGKAESVG